MRLFIAVELSSEAREHLRVHARALHDSAEGWRWTPPEQWHLTLAFLGNVDPGRLDELHSRMRLAARRHDPFDLRLEGMGAFDSVRRARVVWAGLGGDRDALAALAATVQAGARRAKVPVEERRFRPHVTLGRRRQPTDLREARALDPAFAGPPWRVPEFVLVESHLGAVVRHEIRERYPLGRNG